MLYNRRKLWSWHASLSRHVHRKNSSFGTRHTVSFNSSQNSPESCWPGS